MGTTDSKTFEGNVFHSLTGHTRAVLHCAFTSDGEVLATCSADKTVVLWTVSTGEVLRKLEGHTDEVTCCCFYENVLATSSKDKTVILWLYKSGRRASRLAIHYDAVLSCTISQNGEHLATCSKDKTVRLIKFQPGSGAFVNGSEMKKLNGHQAAVNDVQFTKSNYFLASASDDKTIRYWNTDTGTCMRILDDPCGPVKKLRFLPSGSHMISLSTPGNIITVWNAETQVVENVLETKNGREIQNIEVTPDGRVTIGLSKDNKITLWENLSKKSFPELRSTHHKREVNTIAIASKDCLVATGDGEGTVFIWT